MYRQYHRPPPAIEPLRTRSITKADIVIFIIAGLIELIQIISYFACTCETDSAVDNTPFGHFIQIIASR